METSQVESAQTESNYSEVSWGDLNLFTSPVHVAGASSVGSMWVISIIKSWLMIILLAFLLMMCSKYSFELHRTSLVMKYVQACACRLHFQSLDMYFSVCKLQYHVSLYIQLHCFKVCPPSEGSLCLKQTCCQNTYKSQIIYIWMRHNSLIPLQKLLWMYIMNHKKQDRPFTKASFKLHWVVFVESDRRSSVRIWKNRARDRGWNSALLYSPPPPTWPVSAKMSDCLCWKLLLEHLKITVS